MKKIKVNAENWINGDQFITITGAGYSRTVKSKITDPFKVEFKAIGKRSRSNKPTWHVGRDGNVDDGIAVSIDSTKAMVSGYGVERTAMIGGALDITDAVAAAAWKLYCNI
jgi:hypothetical protein